MPRSTKSQREWYLRNRERLLAWHREHYARDPEKHKERARRYREKNPDHHRDQRLKRLYGLTKAEYLAMLESQGGGCAICGEPQESRGGKRAAVDHCHETGQVRALLCTKCNTGLGAFRDRTDLLAKAAMYLKHHAEKHRESA